MSNSRINLKGSYPILPFNSNTYSDKRLSLEKESEYILPHELKQKSEYSSKTQQEDSSLKDIILLSLEDGWSSTYLTDKPIYTKGKTAPHKKKQQHKNKTQRSNPLASQKLFYHMTKDIVRQNKEIQLKSVQLQMQLLKTYNIPQGYYGNTTNGGLPSLSAQTNSINTLYINQSSYRIIPNTINNSYFYMNPQAYNFRDLKTNNYNNYQYHYDSSPITY